MRETKEYVKIDLITGRAELWENYKRVCVADVETVLRKIGLWR